MSKNWEYNKEKTKIIIEPPKQRLRITGHRLSSVLGLNKYQSPFGAWAEITKLVKLPFEDTKYTIAGKVLEPKLIEYTKTKLPNVVSIKDYYGNVFIDYEYNNFKDDSNIFGGVMDAVSTLNDKRTLTAVIECKSSSKPQEWANNMVPIEYLLQGCLYSYLKGIPDVVFVCVFLTELDYAHPENVEISEDNTIIVVKKLKDIYFEVDGQLLNIEGCIQYATEWWNKYIETGISPEFDEKMDKEYLDIIRSTDMTKDNDLQKVCDMAYNLSRQIEELEKSTGITEMKKDLKALETSIKNEMISSDVSVANHYKLTKSVGTSFDEETFSKEHKDLYDKYCSLKETYRLSKIKE